jgi:hypothetical protein
MAAPVHAGFPRPGDRPADGGQHVDLPLRAAGIGLRQQTHRLLRGAPGAQVSEAGRPVERIHQRLRGQRTDATARVHAQRPDGEKAAGDRDAEISLVVACQDGPGHRMQRQALDAR